MDKFSKVIEDFIRGKLEKKGADICIPTWLDSASKRASQISVATHVLKFSHGDARGSNIYAKIGVLKERGRIPYITTGSLIEGKIDIVGNAAVMDVAALLQLEINGTTLLDKIAAEDFSPLAPFADSEARLLRWVEGFKSVLVDRKLSSHTLAKQVYFPVGENKYHLLSPLYASSLSHALYEKINEDRYGDKAKVIRKHKKDKTKSSEMIVDYPNLAYQQFGGTKPLNISRLNSLRGGKSFLLRSLPPVWETVKMPPLGTKSFWKNYERRAWQSLNDFKNFLSENKNHSSNKDFRDKCRLFVDQLLDILLHVSAEVQSLKPGWSVGSKISFAEKIWLDPNFEEHLEQYDLEDWLGEIAEKFVKTVLKFLKNRKIEIGNNDDYDFFMDECINKLKRFK